MLLGLRHVCVDDDCGGCEGGGFDSHGEWAEVCGDGAGGDEGFEFVVCEASFRSEDEADLGWLG